MGLLSQHHDTCREKRHAELLDELWTRSMVMVPVETRCITVLESCLHKLTIPYYA